MEKIYKKRWKIECFFKHMKSNGFNLEDMNFKNLQKASLLVSVISLCYTFSVLRGAQIITKLKIRALPEKLQKIENFLERVSIFRLGLRFMRGFSHFETLFYEIITTKSP